MKLLRKVGVTSEIWQIFIADSTSTTGAGLTGLAHNSSGLTAYYHRDTDTTATAITLVTMTVGTFTSSGFKEIDATNMPGWYQFCPPNAALASGAKSCAFHLKGATSMAPLPIEVDLQGDVNVTHWGASTTPVTNINTIYNTDYATVYDTTNKAFLSKLGNFNHGGVASLLTLERLRVISTTTNQPGITIAGNGSGAGINCQGGATGDAIQLFGGVTSGHGIHATGTQSGDAIHIIGGETGHGLKIEGGSTSGNGINITTTSGHGINVAATGTSMHGVLITGGNGGTSDGLKLAAGTGGVGFRVDTLTVSGATTLSGAVSLGSTLGVTGTTTLAAVTTTGTVTFNAFAVTNTTTLSGAVSLGSTLGVTGTTTLAAVTTTGTVTLNALTVSGATTLTGAVTATNASNDIRGTKLTSAGLDLVLIESGISAGASLTDDAGSQLTSINARQALSLCVSAAAAGVLAGAATTTVTIKPAGLPSGNTRVTATVDSSGNRSALTLKVPT